MAATTGLARQEDGFDKLLKLATLNAADIAKAGDEHRRQIQLTQEEEAKIAAAKDYIIQYATLSADLQRREDELVSNKSLHDKSVSEFAKYVASENIRLEGLAASLDARKTALAASESRHADELKSFATTKSALDRDNAQAISQVKAASDANIQIGKKLVEEEQRLKDWESALKSKAERIRQQVANF